MGTAYWIDVMHKLVQGMLVKFSKVTLAELIQTFCNSALMKKRIMALPLIGHLGKPHDDKR